MMAQQIAKEDRSLGELFTELASETGVLVRQEVALAQAEVTQMATNAGKNVGFLAVGGAIAYLAAFFITAAIVLLLAQYIPTWMSSLIVGAVIAAVSYFVIMSALAELKMTGAAPSETIKSLKEDAKWLKKEVM